MQGLRLKSSDGELELVNFKDDIEIPKLLSAEKIISGNYYIGNYKYTIYFDPISEEKNVSLMDLRREEFVIGDLIIVPQIGEVHDFDYEAINSAMAMSYDGGPTLFVEPAEN
ncbi:hypothetical protein [Lactobacillus sp. PSON]|uniref:hypothetical protein n=1 Tax=Lactobacillus sp. PSON TaxID=3455454 RepID=UPI004041EF2A